MMMSAKRDLKPDISYASGGNPAANFRFANQPLKAQWVPEGSRRLGSSGYIVDLSWTTLDYIFGRPTGRAIKPVVPLGPLLKLAAHPDRINRIMIASYGFDAPLRRFTEQVGLPWFFSIATWFGLLYFGLFNSFELHMKLQPPHTSTDKELQITVLTAASGNNRSSSRAVECDIHAGLTRIMMYQIAAMRPSSDGTCSFSRYPFSLEYHVQHTMNVGQRRFLSPSSIAMCGN
ncbi:hypothetical protein C8R44DRAFT_730472 [Mycena epipterygia]|nr:hypothetical protein C8R44DRAFT_730472 [Mycena epipterygia]